MIDLKHLDQHLQYNELSINVSCSYIFTEIHAYVIFVEHDLVTVDDITYLLDTW